jgi:putative heme iron utilization protein
MAKNAALPPDQIAAMIAHMNADHADSVLGYVHHYAKLSAAESATLVSLDANGMLVHAMVDGTPQSVAIAFDHTLVDAADARDTLIAMARAEGH